MSANRYFASNATSSEPLPTRRSRGIFPSLSRAQRGISGGPAVRGNGARDRGAGGGEQFALQGGERRQVALAQPPLQLGVLANRSGGAARRVEQHGGEAAPERRKASVADDDFFGAAGDRHQPPKGDVVADNVR